MNTGYYLIMAFAFLRARQEETKFLAGRNDSAFVIRLVLEGLELFLHALVLVALYVFALRPLIPAGEVLPGSLFFLPGTCALVLIRKQDLVFLITVYGISLFTASGASGSSPLATVSVLAGMAFLILLVTLLLLGAVRRLRLSRVPARMQGLPIRFLTAALVSLILWGFQGIFTLTP